MATGLAIMGFGGGALVAAPLTQVLLDTYATDPAASRGDGLVPTLLTLGAIYLALMSAEASLIQLPHPAWRPAGWMPTIKKGSLQTHADVRVRNAVRTPAFYLLWIVLFVNATAGIGILEDAKPMIMDFFPNTVTGAAATGFVGLLSLANMSGRFGWSALPDRIGRKATYLMYLGVGALLYATLVVAGDASTVLFVVVAFFIVSFYGGGFATIPAYLKDLFGDLEVGAIHERLLTARSAAGVAGPLLQPVDRAGSDRAGTGSGRVAELRDPGDRDHGSGALHWLSWTAHCAAARAAGQYVLPRFPRIARARYARRRPTTAVRP